MYYYIVVLINKIIFLSVPDKEQARNPGYRRSGNAFHLPFFEMSCNNASSMRDYPEEVRHFFANPNPILPDQRLAYNGDQYAPHSESLDFAT